MALILFAFYSYNSYSVCSGVWCLQLHCTKPLIVEINFFLWSNGVLLFGVYWITATGICDLDINRISPWKINVDVLQCFFLVRHIFKIPSLYHITNWYLAIFAGFSKHPITWFLCVSVPLEKVTRPLNTGLVCGYIKGQTTLHQQHWHCLYNRSSCVIAIDDPILNYTSIPASFTDISGFFANSDI